MDTQKHFFKRNFNFQIYLLSLQTLKLDKTTEKTHTSYKKQRRYICKKEVLWQWPVLLNTQLAPSHWSLHTLTYFKTNANQQCLLYICRALGTCKITRQKWQYTKTKTRRGRKKEEKKEWPKTRKCVYLVVTCLDGAQAKPYLPELEKGDL